MTCDDCGHFNRCSGFIGDVSGNTSCDWAPSRFREGTERLREQAEHKENAIVRGLEIESGLQARAEELEQDREKIASIFDQLEGAGWRAAFSVVGKAQDVVGWLKNLQKQKGQHITPEQINVAVFMAVSLERDPVLANLAAPIWDTLEVFHIFRCEGCGGSRKYIAATDENGRPWPDCCPDCNGHGWTIKEPA